MRIAVSLYCLLFGMAMSAQVKFDLDLSKDLKEKDHSYNTLIGMDETSYYTMEKEWNTNYFGNVSYDYTLFAYRKKSHSLIFEEDLSKFKYKGEKGQVAGAFMLNGNLKIIQCFPRDKDNIVYVLRDMKAPNQLGAAKELFTIEGDQKIIPDVRIARSTDGSKLAIAIVHNPFGKDNGEMNILGSNSHRTYMMFVHVFDQNMNVLYQDSKIIRNTSTPYNWEGLVINNEGIVCIGWVADPDKGSRRYFVDRYSEKGKFELEPEVPSVIIHSFKFSYSEETDELIVAGFYQLPGVSDKNHHVHGTFLHRMKGEKLGTQSFTTNRFTPEFMSRNLGYVVNKDNSYYGVDAKECFIADNGDSVLIGEAYANVSGVNSSVDYAMALVHVRYGPDNKVRQLVPITKISLRTDKDDEISYLRMNDNVLMFSDHQNNVEARNKGSKLQDNDQSASTTMAVILRDGQVEYQQVHPSEIHPANSMRLSEKRAFIYLEDIRRINIGEIQLKGS